MSRRERKKLKRKRQRIRELGYKRVPQELERFLHQLSAQKMLLKIRNQGVLRRTWFTSPENIDAAKALRGIIGTPWRGPVSWGEQVILPTERACIEGDTCHSGGAHFKLTNGQWVPYI